MDRASLNGTITDLSGAVVSGASIDLYFAGTGFKRAVLSTNAGAYVMPALPIGHCRITVQARGFQSEQVDDLVLPVGESRTLDFSLSVSVSTDTIQVTASAVALEQDSAETGGVIDSQQVNGLPINGRN